MIKKNKLLYVNAYYFFNKKLAKTLFYYLLNIKIFVIFKIIKKVFKQQHLKFN